MEQSILNSIKKVLGLDADYTAFDEDVLMHINSTFSTLMQLGIGPVDGFMIEDATTTWADYVTAGVPANSLNSVKSLIYLRVRMLYDPPTASFMIAAMEKQIEEFEWRLSVNREYALYPIEEVT